jgi:flagellar biosynthesis protein FliR
MFVVGIPLKMLVGLLVFTTTLPVFVGFSNRIFDELFLAMEKMFANFVGAGG